MITRRAFIKAVTITLTGTSVLSCDEFKSKTGRHDTDDVSSKDTVPVGTMMYVDEVIRMKVTAYCPCSKCCGKWADGVTASGYVIQQGFGQQFVAADKRYPFNTMMFVPGYCHISSMWRMIVPVLDRGGAIKDDHIDVYFDSHQEALNWGVKYLDVTVLSFSQSEDEH